jgi:hypothetical protein
MCSLSGKAVGSRAAFSGARVAPSHVSDLVCARYATWPKQRDGYGSSDPRFWARVPVLVSPLS